MASPLGTSRSLSRFACVCFALAAWRTAALAQTPAPIGQMGTPVLKSAADQYINLQRYGEALPYLEELYTRLKDTTTPESKDMLERVVFYLALGYVTTNKQSEAIRYLDVYLEKYNGQNISRTVNVLDMLAEAYFRTGEYTKAAQTYQTILASRHTPLDQRRTAKLNLMDCYIASKGWDKLAEAARNFVQESGDPDLQGRAATALCQAYVQTNETDRIFELIPLLENSSSTARFRVDFNLAMLAAGDRMFQARDFDAALLLYQIVAPRRFIENLIKERADDLKEKKEALAALRPVPPNLGAQMAAINGEMQRLQEQTQDLKGAASYDEELRTRLAQTFYRQGRKWEALWLYEGLMDDFPDSEYGERAGYAAFALAAELGQRKRAIELGRDYMEQFPKGENYDALASQLTQLMVAAKDYQGAEEMAQKVLEGKKDSIFADKMVFLTGYSLFQSEQMEKAAEMFLRVRKDYPQSGSREAADYWYAMTFLYRNQYEEALSQFKLFAEAHPDGDLHTDAIFRTGVCNYALERYDDAKKIFEDFLVRYPGAPQVAEAHLLLGDIAGNDGRLDDALAHYAKVETLTVNQGNIDLATMATGRILETLSRWDDMIRVFNHYLDTYGTSGLYAEAIYRIGFAKKQKGDIEGMLAGYLDAIKRYGNDANAIGIDMITRDWPKEYQEYRGKSSADLVAAELAQAQTRGDRTLVMRWMMMQEGLARESGPGAPPEVEVTDESLEAASPALLVWLGDHALAKKDAAMARKAYARVLAKFDQNEWYLPALMALGRLDTDEGDDKAALADYAKVRELFPQSPDAAEALFQQAEILGRQKKYQEAIASLELILEVKEWRGEAWARALYKTGEFLREEGNIQEAFAYFQRVYVLYGAYHEWAAKAYLQSAMCLGALGKEEERVKTLREMISQEPLRDRPEYQEAQKFLGGS